ncbi:UDP-sugar diphosphatase [Purpureocillium takamizusanense]|nr:UDP-sugar diphosphatase [Purpureocillium takamizusanense]UNI23782.1 UDP-sugar diphosphatase [Purpureocillium takamizusanense]
MALTELAFLHFNDVYHISKQARIARFLTQLQWYRKKHAHLAPYTIFSGDVFSPSLEASILQGAHMVPLLRELKIDLACYGNHDFDFGEQRLSELTAETNFPWLLSNAFRRSSSTTSDLYNGTERGHADGRLLAGAVRYHTAVLQGFKVGFFGLAGTDWPSNCRELPHCTIASPVDVSRACARHLRQSAKCDLVVALTHMRLAEDIEVSEALRAGPPQERVDLLLGGHDHELLRRYGGEVSAQSKNPMVIDCSHAARHDSKDPVGEVPQARGDIRIVKSGTDWHSLSFVRMYVGRTAGGVATLESVAVEQILDLSAVPMDPVVLSDNEARVRACLRGVNDRIDELGADPLVHTTVDLEGTGTIIRSSESNLGNMLADIVRAYYLVDIALVNSGSIRCGKVIRATISDAQSAGSGKPPLTVRDLIEILPFDNALMVKRVTSEALLEALENSFSDAHTDGRFFQYAGLTVVADWTQPEGSRVLEAWFCPDKSRPETRTRICRGDGRSFTTAMIAFIAEGFDGYTCFKDQETLVTEEGAITDTQLLLRTLGYGHHEEGEQHDEAVDEDEARFRRAREVIVTSWDRFGLPVVSPVVEGRITIRGDRSTFT